MTNIAYINDYTVDFIDKVSTLMHENLFLIASISGISK